MAVVLGFEPRQTESESAVLPLHNTTMFLFRWTVETAILIIAKKSNLSMDFSNFFKIVVFFSLCGKEKRISPVIPESPGQNSREKGPIFRYKHRIAQDSISSNQKVLHSLKGEML